MSGRAPLPPTLWDWAVATYARPGVKDALLALQDRHGVDVPSTLWRAWLWRTGRRADGEAEARAIALSAAWRAQITAPLRAARNALKAPPGEIEPDAARVLRQRILDAELASERLQLEALERLAGDAEPVSDDRPDLCGWLMAFPPLRAAPAVEISALVAALESA